MKKPSSYGMLRSFFYSDLCNAKIKEIGSQFRKQLYESSVIKDG